ncbi:hypothetical protein HFP72_01295 [Nocardiopsis sp. ARC36]
MFTSPLRQLDRPALGTEVCAVRVDLDEQACAFVIHRTKVLCAVTAPNPLKTYAGLGVMRVQHRSDSRRERV